MPEYQIRIQSVFSAAHALTIGGSRETMHGHDWRVTALIAGPHLDEDGLLLDFHQLESMLESILKPMRNQCLNDLPPFSAGRINPSAEQVARFIGEQLNTLISSKSFDPSGANSCTLRSVSVTEAPGCEATCILQDQGTGGA